MIKIKHGFIRFDTWKKLKKKKMMKMKIHLEIL